KDEGSNVTSGNTYLIANDDIGEELKPLRAMVGNIEGISTTGSTWVVNDGALTEGGVPETTGDTGWYSGGDNDETALSPITITENVSAGGNIIRTAAESLDPGDTGDDITIKSGVTVESTGGGDIIFYVGDDFTLEADALIKTSGNVYIYADFGGFDPVDGSIINKDPGVGSIITIYGTIEANDLIIQGAGDKDYIYNYGTIKLGNTVYIYGEETEDEIILTNTLWAKEIVIDGKGGDDIIIIDIQPPESLVGHVKIYGRGGEDLIIINKLQSRTDPVDIDGGEGRDQVFINTRGSDTDQLTRIYDTGTSGVDEVTINGTAEDDVFLLRAMALPNQTTPDTGFVAKLNQDGTAVERFN
ncbi:MAG: hypothetical protein ACOWWM_10325, partial [Desulfobacterales bacterium]